MSRVYFHTQQRTAELRGSERAFLGYTVARNPANAAWNLDGADAFDRCAQIIAMIPEVPGGQYGTDYLHDDLRAANAHREGAAGQPDAELERRLVKSLQTRLHLADFAFGVADQRLHCFDVSLNTALAEGPDAVALAAKIHGLCELNGWIDGPDRKWLADLIDDSLQAGVYRHGLWYEPAAGAQRKWSDQGWGDVTALLRESDDGPVVMSYSVCDGFPNSDIADWEPVVDDDWLPEWAADGAGRAEWDELTDDDRAERRKDHAVEEWDDLPAEEQWRLGMEGLRTNRPWARIGPDNLRTQMFGPVLTAYDLLAPDRDERVRAACAMAEA